MVLSHVSQLTDYSIGINTLWQGRNVGSMYFSGVETLVPGGP